MTDDEARALAADFESAAEMLDQCYPLLAAELRFEAGLAKVAASWHRFCDGSEQESVVRIAE